MKRGVEAVHLRQMRMTLTKCLDQFDLAWQVIRCEGRRAMQLGEHVRRDSLWLRVCHPMDHTVSDSPHVRKLLTRFKPVHQKARRGLVVWHLRVTLAAPSLVARHDRVVPLWPIRSRVPDSDGFSEVPALFTANLMLDEPPLIARIEAAIEAMSLKRYTRTAHCDEEWHLGCPAADNPEMNEANV